MSAGTRHGQQAYVPAFDGYRALCIIGVVCFHVGPTSAGWLESLRLRGWFGVDAFFVLSGFLITSILLGELDRRGTIALPRFYLRRALRLQPAYLSTVLAIVLVTRLFSAKDYQTVAPALPYILTYTLNLAVGIGGLLPPAFLLITWSLCVEEQFYLGWPWLLRTLGAAPMLRALPWIIGLLAAWRSATYLSLASGQFWEPAASIVNRLMMSTDMRIDGIFVGCLIALAMRANRPGWLWTRLRTSRPLPSLAVLLAVATIWWLHAPDMLPIYILIGPTATAAVYGLLLAVIFLQPDSWPARLLAQKPLIFIGRVSYGVYLFHYFLADKVIHLVGVRRGDAYSMPQELLAITIVLSASVLLAWLHYVLIEARVMAWREKIS